MHEDASGGEGGGIGWVEIREAGAGWRPFLVWGGGDGLGSDAWAWKITASEIKSRGQTVLSLNIGK
mgnify:CR=1 FL=1